MVAEKIVVDEPGPDAAGLARQVNAHILALEARIREMGLRTRTPDEDAIGLLCECGCLGVVAVQRGVYERGGGAWLEGHKPG